MDFLLQDIMRAPFWIAAAQIIGVNIVLSGDNAVVIALACRMLPKRQRFWGMVLGAGAAVVLRILFTLVVARAMEYAFLKLIGGALLLWVAVKLVVPEHSESDGKVKAADNLWRAVRIVVIADIVMSLDNVIAIAATAEIAAAQVDIAHAGAIKAALIMLRSCDQRSAHHRRQRVADGVARPLSDPGLGRRRAARLGRRRYHDQGDAALFDWFPADAVERAHYWAAGDRRHFRRRPLGYPASTQAPSAHAGIAVDRRSAARGIPASP